MCVVWSCVKPVKKLLQIEGDHKVMVDRARVHGDGRNSRIVSSVDVAGAAESVQIGQAVENVVRVSTRRDDLEGV